eukprot:9954913-Lingulodinium_polyedra.AAC.1
MRGHAPEPAARAPRSPGARTKPANSGDGCRKRPLRAPPSAEQRALRRRDQPCVGPPETAGPRACARGGGE